MRSRVTYLFVLCLLPVLIAAAQTPTKPAPPKPATVQSVETVPDASVEVLKLRIAQMQEQLNLVSAQRDICGGQLAQTTYAEGKKQVQAFTDGIVADFEKAHPGWTIDPQTGVPSKKPAVK